MEAILVEFGMTFVLALIGAVFKDYYNTITNVDEKVQIPRILLSAVTGSIVIYSFNIKTKFGDRLFPLFAFGSGILGLQMFSKIKGLDIDKLLYMFNKK